MITGKWLTKMVYINGSELNPEKSRVLRQHSYPTPENLTGYSWGNGSGGSAQLALAMLLQFTESEKDAIGLYQDFKNYKVGTFRSGCDFELEEKSVKGWIENNATEKCKKCGCLLTKLSSMKFKDYCEVCHDSVHPELVPEDEKQGANDNKV